METRQYKDEFIKFMVSCGALSFGDFVLKSGRHSPFFMNAGAYTTGSQLATLGEFYATAIHERFGDDFDVLFGPAYKGIPLSVATVIAYNRLFSKDIRYCSNRKEAKDHGETGILLGTKLKDGDRVMLIEDVTTSGKSIDETVPILRAQGNIKIAGLMVSLDRQEKSGKEQTADDGNKKEGGKSLSALEEISEKYGFPTAAIITMTEAVDFLMKEPCDGKIIITDRIKSSIDKYYSEFGAF